MAYFPASDRYHTLTSNHYSPVKELAAWRMKVIDNWYNIKIKDVDVSAGADIQVNQTVTVTANIDLATLSKDDVCVELYQGTIDANGEIVDAISVPMQYQGDKQGLSAYSGNIVYESSGYQGLSLRVLPQHEHLSSPYELRLILWA